MTTKQQLESKAALEALIAALESAEGPSRELDCRIHVACVFGGQWVKGARRMGDFIGESMIEVQYLDPSTGKIICWFPRGQDVPHYTASIDHALMTLEDGWEYNLSTLYGMVTVELPLNDSRIDSEIVQRKDMRMPLAILIARFKAGIALKARLADAE